MQDFEPKLDVLRAFKRVQESMRRQFEAKFKDLGLTGPQALLLSILGHRGKMRVSDISEKMHLSNSTVSSILDRLEAQGYVERVRSSEDKRAVYIDLTPSFKDKAKDRFCSADSELSQLLGQVTEAQRRQILESLNLLADLIDQQTKQVAPETPEKKTK